MNKRLRECSSKEGESSTQQHKRLCAFPRWSLGAYQLSVPSKEVFSRHAELSLRPVAKAAAEEAVSSFFSGTRNLTSTLIPACTYLRTPLNLPHGEAARQFQIQFRSRLPQKIYAGSPIKADDKSRVHIVLVDTHSNEIVKSGPLSSIEVQAVVMDGQFCHDGSEDWSKEEFCKNIVRPRDGKPNLLKGNLSVKLRNGSGRLGNLCFTDNSHRTKNGSFKLGVRALDNSCEVREALTGALSVKDSRGKSYKKHHPPSLNDEVWRLERIAKDGAFHRKLRNNEINTVGEFVQILSKDEASLFKILGMPIKSWKSVITHSQECRSMKKDNAEDLTCKNQNDIYELNSAVCPLSDHILSSSNTVGPFALDMYEEGLVSELQKEPSQLLEIPDTRSSYSVQQIISSENVLLPQRVDAALFNDPLPNDDHLSIHDYGVYDDTILTETRSFSIGQLVDPFETSQYVSQASSFCNSWDTLLIIIKCGKKFLAAKRKATIPLISGLIQKNSGPISKLQKEPFQFAEISDMQSFHSAQQLFSADEIFPVTADAPYADPFSSCGDQPCYDYGDMFWNETGSSCSFLPLSDPFETSEYFSQVSSSANGWVKLLTTIKCGRKFLAVKRKATVPALVC